MLVVPSNVIPSDREFAPAIVRVVIDAFAVIFVSPTVANVVADELFTGTVEPQLTTTVAADAMASST